MIAALPEGAKYTAALDWNIPIVSIAWLQACEAQRGESERENGRLFWFFNGWRVRNPCLSAYDPTFDLIIHIALFLGSLR